MSGAPQKEGEANPGFEDPTTLARLDALEGNTADNKKNLKLVQNTNWLIIIVLFVAVVAIILAAIYQYIDAIKSDAASRQQLIQSVDDLRTDVRVLERSQPSTSATTSPKQ